MVVLVILVCAPFPDVAQNVFKSPRIRVVWMGRRRGGQEEAPGETATIAGRGAPADYFRRVLNGVNEMAEYRLDQERRGRGGPPVAAVAPKPGPAAPSLPGQASRHPKGGGRELTQQPRRTVPLPPRRPEIAVVR